MCNTAGTPVQSKKRSAILALAVVIPVLVAAILILAYLTWRARRKPNSAYAVLLIVKHAFILSTFIFTDF